MPWEKPKTQQSMPCDSAKLRKFRKSLGWTQKTLAQKSGYSERLIRKAEAGDSLDPETIEHLAEALSDNGLTVRAEDLCATPLMLVRGFLEAFAEFGPAGVVSASQHFFSDDLEIWIAGDPRINHCAGTYYGLDGLQEYFSRLLSTFEFPSIEPTFSASGNEVFVHGIQTMRIIDGGEVLVVWAVNHYIVRNAKIAVWKNHYDTASVERLLRQIPESE